MTNPPVRSRRPWKRWVAFVAVVGVGWVLIPPRESSIDRAKRVQLNMTSAEVDEIMSPSRRSHQAPGTITGPIVVYSTRREEREFYFKVRLAGFCEWIGVVPPSYGQWPVTVGFDNDGLVRFVTRGNEAISR
jgi:hypothetical protein